MADAYTDASKFKKGAQEHELDRMEEYDRHHTTAHVRAISEEAERLRMENTRLREALTAWIVMVETDNFNETMLLEHIAYTKSIAALTDTADDWLSAHDAEVRAQERERCADAARHACCLCGGTGQIDDGNGEIVECDWCGDFIAAIREEEANDI